jgi:hypothetical protein
VLQPIIWEFSNDQLGVFGEWLPILWGDGKLIRPKQENI